MIVFVCVVALGLFICSFVCARVCLCVGVCVRLFVYLFICLFVWPRAFDWLVDCLTAC